MSPGSVLLHVFWNPTRFKGRTRSRLKRYSNLASDETCGAVWGDNEIEGTSAAIKRKGLPSRLGGEFEADAPRVGEAMRVALPVHGYF